MLSAPSSPTHRSIALAATLLVAGTMAAGCATAQARGPNANDAGTLAKVSARAVRDSVQAVLDRGLADRAFPGAYAVVGSHNAIYAGIGVGHLDWAPSPVPDQNTMWDMASLTKVVATTTAIMQLYAAHKVDLEAPVQRYLPRFVGAHKELVTVRELLTHSSGLPAWRPLYKEATSPENAIDLVYETPLDTLPGVRMVYSDLGGILMGLLVEKVSGEPLDQYVHEHIFEPLKMTSTMYRPPASLLARIAPTERDPWRQRLVHGEVHDENAYFMGGVSGHAGLFSSGHDLARFAQMYLNHGTLDGVKILDPAVIDTFTRVQDPTLSNRALGWEVPSGTNSAGHLLSSHAFGHTGFTGTSIWIDPDRDLFIILLTNRVDPTRANTKIGGVRVALADAVAEAAGVTPAAASSKRPGSQ